MGQFSVSGNTYVELSGGSPEAPLLRAKADNDYPLIGTKPSLSAHLENVLTLVLAELNDTSFGVNRLLSAENQVAFTNALSNIATMPRTIAARKDAIDSGINNAARTFENTARLAAQTGPMINRISRSADAVGKMGDEVASAGVSAGQTANSIGADVKRFTAETAPELERLLGELSVRSASLRRLTEQTERNPSGLLFGRGPVSERPGESSTGSRQR